MEVCQIKETVVIQCVNAVPLSIITCNYVLYLIFILLFNWLYQWWLLRKVSLCVKAIFIWHFHCECFGAQSVACTDFLKGGGEKERKGHIQHVLATEEGTLVQVFATQEGSYTCFGSQKGTLARVLAPRRAPWRVFQQLGQEWGRPTPLPPPCAHHWAQCFSVHWDRTQRLFNII